MGDMVYLAPEIWTSRTAGSHGLLGSKRPQFAEFGKLLLLRRLNINDIVPDVFFFLFLLFQHFETRNHS